MLYFFYKAKEMEPKSVDGGSITRPGDPKLYPFSG